MAEQFLHAAQIAAIGQQMRGEGMPQSMRRRTFRKSQTAAKILHQQLRLARAHRFSAAGDKQCRLR